MNAAPFVGTRSYWLAGWAGVVTVGFVNGGINRAYAGAMIELTGHKLSCLTYVLLPIQWVLYLQRHRPLATAVDAALVGAVWALATVTFEFLIGHYVLGDSWAKLINAYNILNGRLWGIVVLAIAAAPAGARRLWLMKTHLVQVVQP